MRPIILAYLNKFKFIIYLVWPLIRQNLSFRRIEENESKTHNAHRLA